MEEKTCCCENKTFRSEEERKKLMNRLSRIEGQIRGIRGMIEKDAYCADILVQSAAVTAAESMQIIRQRCPCLQLAAVILVDDMRFKVGDDIMTVYTTRVDTIFGVTFCVLAPEHKLVKKWLDEGKISNKAMEITCIAMELNTFTFVVF